MNAANISVACAARCNRLCTWLCFLTLGSLSGPVWSSAHPERKEKWGRLAMQGRKRERNSPASSIFTSQVQVTVVSCCSCWRDSSHTHKLLRTEGSLARSHLRMPLCVSLSRGDNTSFFFFSFSFLLADMCAVETSDTTSWTWSTLHLNTCTYIDLVGTSVT